MKNLKILCFLVFVMYSIMTFAEDNQKDIKFKVNDLLDVQTESRHSKDWETFVLVTAKDKKFADLYIFNKGGKEGTIQVVRNVAQLDKNPSLPSQSGMDYLSAKKIDGAIDLEQVAKNSVEIKSTDFQYIEQGDDIRLGDVFYGVSYDWNQDGIKDKAFLICNEKKEYLACDDNYKLNIYLSKPSGDYQRMISKQIFEVERSCSPLFVTKNGALHIVEGIDCQGAGNSLFVNTTIISFKNNRFVYSGAYDWTIEKPEHSSSSCEENFLTGVKICDGKKTQGKPNVRAVEFESESGAFLLDENYPRFFAPKLKHGSV